MGEVRISFMPLKNYPIDNLEPCFELMCTNKENYKVKFVLDIGFTCQRKT